MSSKYTPKQKIEFLKVVIDNAEQFEYYKSFLSDETIESAKSLLRNLKNEYNKLRPHTYCVNCGTQRKLYQNVCHECGYEYPIYRKQNNTARNCGYTEMFENDSDAFCFVKEWVDDDCDRLGFVNRLKTQADLSIAQLAGVLKILDNSCRDCYADTPAYGCTCMRDE